MQKHLLAIAVILTVASGCDNVGWGGIAMELEPPPASTRVTEVVEDTADAAPVNEDAPLLLAGLRDGGRASMVVVGELFPEAVHPFPDPRFPEDLDRLAAHTAPGAEWTLFSEGVRVGRLIVDVAGQAQGFCLDRTRVEGVVELVPDAATATRLLALPASDGSGWSHEEYRELAHDYDQRVATLEIAGDAIPEQGAPWPTLGVLDARDHIQAFDPGGDAGPSIAATFVHQDELSIGPPGQGAYALFVIGERGATGYDRAFTWYRAVESEGKGVPRYFDHLDLDGDGENEIVLDVFGADRRWFAVLDRRDGGWTRAYQDACGSGSTTTN